jgi:crotonobetainyl-CoA:carnitine CoA-transferase CaiB-like acyl-CoA transferase
MTLALDGVRIVDLTQVMGGPFCTMQLADLGADVIKVEPPGGDLSRSMGGTELEMPGDDNAPFFALNRNKRSIVLDLTRERDTSIFRALVRTADVLVESFRPGVTRRLGVDYDAMTEINPRLIYASISGFGQTGPYANRPGFDLIAQGMSGVMSVTGDAGGVPVKCGVPIADLSVGLIAANGVLAALIAREKTGRGQYIDTSLFDDGILGQRRDATRDGIRSPLERTLSGVSHERRLHDARGAHVAAVARALCDARPSRARHGSPFRDECSTDGESCGARG